MRYAVIYTLILISFIAVSIYVSYCIMHIGMSSERHYSIMTTLQCLYSRSICITTEPVKVLSINLTTPIGIESIHIIAIGGIYLIVPTNVKTSGENCTKPPCIIINTLKEIKVEELSTS